MTQILSVIDELTDKVNYRNSFAVRIATNLERKEEPGTKPLAAPYLSAGILRLTIRPPAVALITDKHKHPLFCGLSFFCPSKCANKCDRVVDPDPDSTP